MGVYEATTTGLTKIEPIPFNTEREMMDFVVDNIGVLFPGLENVKNEMSEKNHRFDTVAYDHNQNTFVVIEYKNKETKNVFTQAMAYLNTMRDNQSDLILAHKDKPNDYKYDWKASYSIIIAPSFDKFTKGAATGRDDMELYTIKKYGNRIVMVEWAGGDHKRPDPPAAITREQPTGQQNTVGTPLAAIQYQKGMKCEGWLTRNGERKTKVDSWVGLLVVVMNEVNPQKPIKRGVRWLVNHTPQHDNGKKFYAPKQLSNGMWLETGSKGPPYILKICNGFPVAKELGLELH